MTKKFRLHGSELEVQVSGYAGQADGEAWLQCGKSVVFAAAVAAKKETDFIGFMPLTVEFRERPAAAGKFPSGFIKRENRLSDRETLASRVIDRSIRPFFPANFFNEVQVLSTVFSADGLFPTVVMGILASSIALITSGIPFLGPVGAVQLSRLNGEWMINPNYETSNTSKDSITVAGNKDGICMVEGKCNQISEDELLKILSIARAEIKLQLDWQEEIRREFPKPQLPLSSQLDFDEWRTKIRAKMPNEWAAILFSSDKKVLGKNIENTKKAVITEFQPEIESGLVTKAILELLFDLEIKRVIPDVVIKSGRRFDGRAFNQVRPISGTVGFLPCAHGSATFRRGDTHALSTVALGTGSDAQKEDSLFEATIERTFMLHYNFPPYSTGECKPMRAVGRREIGHGYLAERSFGSVLPDQVEFPYTVRSVVDILECYGSSSMATVCATTMSLMDAGVPISSMVAGIAMGLFGSADGQFVILSDISGAEDAYGLMDFKVVGTERGITAFQMDVKAKAGIPEEIMAKALFEAKIGRENILSEMRKVIDSPRPEVAPTAPRVFIIKISPEKIGMLIGPGGKNIKEITSQTGAQIDIEDDGTVKVYAVDKTTADKAVALVRATTGEIEVGYSCLGQIRGITDFGMFVEIVPGKDGLVHVSSMSKYCKDNFAKQFKIGDKLEVSVESVDKVSGRVKLLAASLK
jgi:polyribonucleotide nucleotidyltransferase